MVDWPFNTILARLMPLNPHCSTNSLEQDKPSVIMASLLKYLPIITSGLLLLSILTLLVSRKNLRLQSEYQIYARMIEARLNLETTETFIKMAKESPYYAERFSLVETPDQFYMLRVYEDLYEFFFVYMGIR